MTFRPPNSAVDLEGVEEAAPSLAALLASVSILAAGVAPVPARARRRAVAVVLDPVAAREAVQAASEARE